MISNKQIKRIISISDIMQIVNYLQKHYISFERKSFNKNNIIDRGIVYRLLCSNMFNLIDAIRKSKDIFEDLIPEYKAFEKEINRKYVSNDTKYYKKGTTSMTLFELLREMRHEMNHFEKDVNDQITLFEIEVKYDDMRKLKETTEILINKKMQSINKKTINQLILSRPKIIYETDRIDNSIEIFKTKIQGAVCESEYRDDMLHMTNVISETFRPDFLIELVNNDSDAIEKFNSNLRELEQISLKYDEEILLKGTEEDIKKYNAMKLLMQDFELKTKKAGPEKYKNGVEDLIKKTLIIYGGKNENENKEQ